MNPVTVSIIVPVYNAHDTLTRCLDSIRAQTFSDWELFLINDGSTDDSLAICRAFAAEEARATVIDVPNRGVSAARNVGIELAGGEYLQFVDSDDYLAPTMTEMLVSRARAHDSDLVVCDFYRVIEPRMAAKSHIRAEEKLTKKEFAEYFLRSPADYYYGVMWNKLYRRSLVQDWGIRCCTDMRWCEDLLFNLEYYRCAESFSAIAEPLYYYIANPAGLCAQGSGIRSAWSVKRALFASYKAVFESADIYDRHKIAIRRFFVAAARDGGVPPWATIPSLSEHEENAPISHVDWRALLEKIIK